MTNEHEINVFSVLLLEPSFSILWLCIKFWSVKIVVCFFSSMATASLKIQHSSNSNSNSKIIFYNWHNIIKIHLVYTAKSESNKKKFNWNGLILFVSTEHLFLFPMRVEFYVKFIFLEKIVSWTSEKTS